jgi:hypothetical protein
MRQAQSLRASAWLVLALAAGSAGCTHNYYYGSSMPICPEASTTVNSYGSVCEVPTVGGSMVAQGSGTTVITGAPRPTRVVVSEPLQEGVPVRGARRFAWRRSDPESSLATTRLEGELKEDSVSR